jgi:hypothetical protein
MNKLIKQEQIEKEQQEQIVNGVNISKLFGTVEAIKGNPEIAKFNSGQKVNG